MQVTSARDRLAEAMNLVGSVVNQRSANPITQNVMLLADENGLEIRATDLEVSLRTNVSEVEVTKPGRCLVQASLAASLLKDIRSETVTLEADGAQVTLRAGRDRYELASVDPEEFPRLPERGQGDAVELAAADLVAAFHRVGRSVAQEKGRYALNGVFIEPFADRVEFCGTDGRRLGWYMAAAKGKKVDYQIIVPVKGYNLLGKVLGGGDGTVKLVLTENRLFAEVGGTEIATQLVQGQFPDYRSVLPANLDKTFTAARDDFRNALAKARHLTSVESQAVAMEIAASELVIRSKSPAYGKAEVHLDIDYSGESVAIGFDPQYLLQGLDGVDGDTVHFEFRDSDTGAIMHGGDKEKFFYLVMPIEI